MDSLISALYESTRHTSEKPQDLERFRSLFVPNAVLVQTGSPGYYAYEYGVEQFIEEARYYRERDPSVEWFMTELFRDTHELSRLAHVFSCCTYGDVAAEGTPRIRDTNSFHLVKDNEGSWRITSWNWSVEFPRSRD